MADYFDNLARIPADSSTRYTTYEVVNITVIPVSKRFFVGITLPGMGRSIDLINQSADDVDTMRRAYHAQDLAVEFIEEPGTTYPVIQLWINPHGDQVTLFI